MQIRSRVVGAWRRMGVSRREALIVALLVAAGVALRLIAFLATNGDKLVGDEDEYHASASLFADGKLFWGLAPSGIPHESVFKAPLYGAWLGTLYTILGDSPVRAEAVQVVLGGGTIVLTWLLARRLFGQGVAITAAAIVSVYPFIWLYGGELYPEALAIPLLVLTLWAFLGREPTPRLAVAVGALLGLNLLLRPTSVFLYAGVAVAFLLAAGFRRGVLLTAISVGVALLLISPWTVRNAVVKDAFVLISVQDGAVHGTFNEASAADDEYPYAWRAFTPLTRRLLKENPRIDEVELRRRYHDAAWDYIKDHPDSLAKAFFWNGLSRLWDVRTPDHALEETEFDGRSRTLATVGLGMYYVLAPLAIWGLVTLRRRRELLLPILAMLLAACVVFSIDSGTRYRAPLEPLIVILACVPLVRKLDPLAARLTGQRTPPEVAAA